MSNWITTKLGDVCEVVRGGSPRPIMDFVTDSPDGVNWLKIGDVSEHDKYFIHSAERIIKAGIVKSREVRKGDLILSNSMSFGRAFITLIDGCIHDGWLRLRNDERLLDREFLYYFLSSEIAQNQFKSVATGSVVNNLKSDTVKAVDIDLPSLGEQREIASILSVFDDKIANNTKINHHLEQVAQAIFKSWFVDFEPFGGVMPSDWCFAPFESLIAFQEGPGIRSWQYVPENGRKFLNIRCIQDGDLRLDTASMISTEEAENKYSHFMLNEWDMVLSTSGTLGRYAIVRKEHLPLCLNTSIIRFVPKKSFDHYSYMFSYLTSAEFSNHLQVKATGSAQVNFGPMHLKQIELLLPSNKVMQKYHAAIFPLLERMIENKRESQHLIALRDTLLPRLMSGEMKVGDLD